MTTTTVMTRLNDLIAGHVLRRMILGIAAMCVAALAHADMEIITLRHRTAEQVMPVLKPLVEAGGALSGMNDQVVIRASRANILQLRKVIDSIDTVARRLMISVRQDAAGGVDERSLVAGAVAGGSTPTGERGVSARVVDSRAASENRLVQRIQAIEGAPALIQIGQSIPVTSRTTTQGPGGAVVSDSLVYRDATIGFDVVPRIVGDRAILEISPRRDTPGAGGAINVQRMASTASGRLGEWFELGGMTQDESRQAGAVGVAAGGVVAGTSGLRQDVRRVWVRIEEIK